MIVEMNAKKAYVFPHKQPIEKKAAHKNHFEKAPVDTVALSGKKKDAVANRVNTIDKVNLSIGLSLDDVNRFLVTEIGKKVEAMFEDAGIEPTAIAGTDWSPEATSERIFQGTTNMYEIWKKQHSEMSDKEVIDSFEKVLRKSVDTGAQEAIGLIEGRGFGDDVIGTAQETMSLVHSKFDDYFENLRSALEDNSSMVPTAPDES